MLLLLFLHSLYIKPENQQNMQAMLVADENNDLSKWKYSASDSNYNEGHLEHIELLATPRALFAHTLLILLQIKVESESSSSSSI